VSRLCDRVTRRASPGLDTDLSGLGLSFIYPGNVRFSCNTLSDLFDTSILDAANSSEFGYTWRPKSAGKRKAVWCAADDCTSD
jgi:hypothetical protein